MIIILPYVDYFIMYNFNVDTKGMSFTDGRFIYQVMIARGCPISTCLFNCLFLRR